MSNLFERLASASRCVTLALLALATIAVPTALADDPNEGCACDGLTGQHLIDCLKLHPECSMIRCDPATCDNGCKGGSPPDCSILKCNASTCAEEDCGCSIDLGDDTKCKCQ